MLPDMTHQERVIDDIKDNAGVMSPERLTDLLAQGRRQRPLGFDETSRAIALRYEGDQVKILKDALMKAYPRTWQRMPIDPVGWLRFFARQDSGVYTQAASRNVMVGDIVDEEATAALARHADSAGIDDVMLEVERRCKTGMKSAAVMLGWRKITTDDPGELVAHVYYPHDVVTISHPSAPDDPRALVAVAVRQARLDTGVKSDLWWVWSREPVEGDDGTLISFGPWSHRRVSEDGKMATPAMVYDGERLPIVICRTAPGAGGVWPEPDRDVVVNVDSLNVARSNRQHVINMQAHSQLVVNSKTKEEADIVVGPDVPLIFQEEGAAAQYLVSGADHEAIKASASRDLEELGVSRGNNPDAYAVEPGEAQSGVSRMIANAPHDQLVAESRPAFKRFEESHLWPTIIDVVNAFDPAYTFPGDARVDVEFAKGKTYEDDAAKTERILLLLDRGLIDEADALVELGRFGSRADAEASLAARQSTRAPALPGRFEGGPFTPRETTEATE
jgi:hypothetical protein